VGSSVSSGQEETGGIGAGKRQNQERTRQEKGGQPKYGHPTIWGKAGFRFRNRR
jgi:hypothetical protein